MEFNLRTSYNETSAFELPDPVAYKACISGIYDIGTRLDSPFEPKRQVVLIFELFDDDCVPATDSSGRQYTIPVYYNATLGKNKSGQVSKLRSVIEKLSGKMTDNIDFNLEVLIGLPCRVQIVHGTKSNGNPKADIDSVMALGGKEKTPKIRQKTGCFMISGTRCSIPDWVPPWIQRMIQASAEWQGAAIPHGNQNSPIRKPQSRPGLSNTGTDVNPPSRFSQVPEDSQTSFDF